LAQMLIASFVLCVCWTLLLFSLESILQKYSKIFIALSPRKQGEYKSRFVSTVHAIIASIAAFYVLLFEKEWIQNSTPDKFPVRTYSTGAYYTVSITLGYWCYDLILMIWHPHLASVGMIAHHLVGIIPFVSGLLCNEMYFFAVVVILAEVSTPFVNIRWFLLVEAKFKNVPLETPLYIINGLFVFSSFLIFRIILIPAELWYYWKYLDVLLEEAHLVIVIPAIFGTFMVLFLSIYWFEKISVGLFAGVRAYIRQKEQKSSKDARKKQKIQ